MARIKRGREGRHREPRRHLQILGKQKHLDTPRSAVGADRRPELLREAAFVSSCGSLAQQDDRVARQRPFGVQAVDTDVSLGAVKLARAARDRKGTV